LEAPRHIIRRAALAVSAVAAFAAAALGLAVPGASASTTFTATTHLTNRLDGGHNTLGAPYWATDTMTRVATLVDNGPDPNRPGFDTYSFSLSDTGTFVTNNNVGNPNGLNPTTPITGTVTGTIKGSGVWTTFDAPTGSADASLVPTSMSGNGTPSYVWPGLFFPQNTDFECPGIPLRAYTTAIINPPFPPNGCGSENTYSYTYKSCSEQWVDSNADNDGDAVGQSSAEQAIIGGISGEACPTPRPSPSHHKPSNGFPTGGVQTGGGLPASSSLVPLIASLAGLGMLIAAGFGIVRLRRQRG
jgi:hypothetical protein